MEGKLRFIRERRRTVVLRVTPEAVVEVRLPLGLREEAVRPALEKHAPWIRQRLEAAEAGLAARAARPLSLPFLGREVPVRPALDGRAAHRDGAFFLPEGSLSELLPAILALYKAEGEPYLRQRAAKLAARFGTRAGRVRVTRAEGRWGSCSGKGDLCFSWRLLAASPAAVDSVVIHELTHLAHFEHSAAFRALERARVPDLDACREELRRVDEDLRARGLRAR